MAFAVGEKKKDEVTSEPNVVPLCDVLLVLLIIFMIATPLIKKGIDVELPVAINTINMPENLEVVLSIKNDGKMFVGQDEVTMDNLQLMVEEAFLTASDPRLYLRADGNINYGKIIEVVYVLKDAGIEIVGIITEIKTDTKD
ncbi:MAG: biopolymer transporter ExbD [Candidatus Aminicenantes bacterium]|nr:biopolymer transporter ExbD [Candidatus Aminicenantes bacterium]MBL7083028.1 biopolymer transporter ExbD [Candidatus Aminicenantes bacterium]